MAVCERPHAAVTWTCADGVGREVQNRSLKRRPMALAPETSLLRIAWRSSAETIESENEIQAETASIVAGSATDPAMVPTPRFASSPASATPTLRTTSRRRVKSSSSVALTERGTICSVLSGRGRYYILRLDSLMQRSRPPYPQVNVTTPPDLSEALVGLMATPDPNPSEKDQTKS
jgi:hypothetical protein